MHAQNENENMINKVHCIEVSRRMKAGGEALNERIDIKRLNERTRARARIRQME